MYAISWENDQGGCVETYREKFNDAVFEASELFASLLVFDMTPEEFAVLYADGNGPLVRVDVYECDSEEDADVQFADATFTPLFHLDSGMNFLGIA